MKRVTLIATALTVAVLAVLTTRAVAQETNTQERSFLTFSNTVEMPGVTLPAGTYVFRLADTPSRNVVQVLSQDEKQVLGQWLFVQAERPDVTDDTVIMFKETAENTIPAIHYWYFPGEKIGKEFVYPKDQAEKIAARTGEKVRTQGGYVTPDQANASNDTSTVQGPGTAGIQQQNQPAEASSTRVNQQAENQAASPDLNRRTVGASGASQPNNQPVGTSGTELPKTASPLPLSGLIGLLSLAAFAGFRTFARADTY